MKKICGRKNDLIVKSISHSVQMIIVYLLVMLLACQSLQVENQRVQNYSEHSAEKSSYHLHAV